jgi:hypothetical protein
MLRFKLKMKMRFQQESENRTSMSSMGLSSTLIFSYVHVLQIDWDFGIS